MRYGPRLTIFLIGIAGGAALAAAMPLDPPARGHGQDHHKVAPGTRFAPEPGHPRTLADATYHDDADGPAPGLRGCAWYEHANFGGRRGETEAGTSLEWMDKAMDDRISAIACHEGCRLLASQDINYTGARRTFRGYTANLGPEWNDRISALRVVCTSDR